MHTNDTRNTSSSEKAVSSKEVDASRHELEEAIMRVWRNVLNIEQIDVQNTFFELGGDSVTLIQMIVELNAEGVGIDLQQLLKDWKNVSLTVMGLAELASMTEQQLLTEIDQLSDEQIDVFLATFHDEARGG